MASKWSPSTAIAVSFVILSSIAQLSLAQSNCQKKSDIVFVLDQSGSIEERNPTNGSWDNWQLIKNFVITFMQNATVSYDGIHFGLVTFGNIAVKRFYLSDYYNITSMTAAVQAIQPGNGETNTWAGLNMMRTQIFNPNNGARPDVPHIAIVITDGFANINTSYTIPEAQQAYSDGIRVYVIGMTNLINETQLQLISSPPQIKGQNYWTTPDYSSLSSVMGSIANETCSPPKTVYPTCQAIDIAFAVPMPRDPASWTYIKNFMKSFINNFLPIGDQATRVAVITYNYNNGATTQIGLSQYHSEADVKAAIDQLTYSPDDNFDDFGAMQALMKVFNTSQRVVQQVAIVVFGGSLTDSTNTVTYANALQTSNIRVIAIDATSALNLQTLRKIATKTTDVIQTIGYQYMQTKVLQLGSILCQAPSGAVCPKKADIVFLLDESTSIVAAPGAYDNWNVYILGFVGQVIDSFPISQDLTRIGVVKFSTTVDANGRIYLNQYNNSVDLKSAVSAEKLYGGETNLADGIRTARNVMFSASNGARVGIPHLLIILTDGKANREADQTVPEANLTKAAGIEVFTIGMTNQIDEAQLKAICSDTVESHYFFANDYSKLSTVIADIVGGSCAAAQTLPPTTTTTTITTTTSPPSPQSTSTTTTPTTTTTTTTPTTTTTTTTTPTTTTTTPTTTTTTTTPTSTTTTPTTTTTTTTTTPTTTTTTTTPTTTTTTPTTTTTTTTPTTTTSTPTATTTTPTTTTPTTTTTTTTTTIPTTSTTTTTTLAPIIGSTLRNPNVIIAGASAGCRKPADVVFLLHRSTNMRFDYYRDYMLGLTQAVTLALSIDGGISQVAAVTFSDTTTVEFYLNNYTSTADARNAIGKLSYGGFGTNLAQAMYLTRTQVFSTVNGARLNNPQVAKVAVIIVDYITDNTTATLIEADNMRKAGISVFVIGSGTILNMYELSAIASYPWKSNLITVTTARNLGNLTEPVKRFVCNDDSDCAGGVSGSPCKLGGICSDAANYIQCSCPAGSAGPKCEQTCSNGADIVFALDVSRVIGLNNFLTVTDFVSQIVQSLDVDSSQNGPTVSRIGVMTFDGYGAKIQFNLNDYNTKNQLLQEVSVPYTAGSSGCLGDAIGNASDIMFQAQYGDRPNLPNYLIIITNGDRSSNSSQIWQKAMAARAKGINILTIGVGPNILSSQLASISSSAISSSANFSSDMTNLFTSSDYNSLLGGVSSVASRLCQTVNYCGNNNMCQHSATCTNVMGGYTCGPCPVMYTGAFCERGCTGVIDLAIILSDSGMVHLERWQNITNLAISVVQNLDISQNRTRVALIYYADQAYVGFQLNQYNSQQDVIQAIRNLPYLGGATNTSGALRLLRRSVFTSPNGDRDNVQNIAVLITNSESTVDQSLTIPEAIQCRLLGYEMVTVRLESQMMDSLEMVGISSFPRESTMLYGPSFKNLTSLTNSIVAATCNSVNECASNPCQHGGTCEDGYFKYDCMCPIGYSGVNCERQCNKTVDIIFVIDISGSTEEEYMNNMALARNISMGLDIDNDVARVSAVAYSTNISGQFYLDQNIGNKFGVLNMFDFYSIGGVTNTPAALEDVFATQIGMRGDRPNAPDIVIIITDGWSNVHPELTLSDVLKIKQANATVYSIAVGNTPNPVEINGLATSLDYVFYYPTNTTASAVGARVLDNLCH